MSRENQGDFSQEEVAATEAELREEFNQTDPEVMQEERQLDIAESQGIQQAINEENKEQKADLKNDPKKLLNELAESLKKNPNLDSRQQKNILDNVEHKLQQVTNQNLNPTEKMVNVLADQQTKKEMTKTQERSIGREM